MIGAIVMILAVIWIYQSAVKANTPNLMMWVGIAGAVFLASQVLLIDVNVYLLEAFRGSEGGKDYERDLASVGDRKNEGGFQGAGGVLLSMFLELMPPLVGLVIVGLIRLKFIINQPFALQILFSGLTDIFSSTAKEAFDTMKSSVVKSDKKPSDSEKSE